MRWPAQPYIGLAYLVLTVPVALFEAINAYYYDRQEGVAKRKQAIPGLQTKEFKFHGRTVRCEVAGKGAPVVVVNAGTSKHALACGLCSRSLLFRQ